MDIHVLGVGEAADPDHPNSAVLVEAAGFRLLIDCGHSVPPVLWRALPEADAVDALYLTHHHPDHAFGLVPVLISWADGGRRKPLTVVATADGRAALRQILAAGGVDPERSLPFALDWRDAEATAGLGPFRLATAPTLHAVTNRALRLEEGGRVFAYSGDGRPTAESEALFAGADLLFHECYTLLPEPSQPFHASWEGIRPLADRLGLAAVRLYHIRADQRTALAAACRDDPRFALALAGERLTV